MIKDWWTEFGSRYPKNSVIQWCDSDIEHNPSRNFNYPYDITYTFNSHGLRSRDLKNVNGVTNILVSGCSHTVGIGVPENMTWHQQLSDMIPNSVVHNVAIGGASPDYVSRSIYIALQHVIPDIIFILWPESSRIEYYRNTEPFNMRITHPQYPRIFVDETHHYNNLKKNQLLVDLLAQDIPVYHGTLSLVNGEGAGLARDGTHGCHVWHRNLAKSFYFKYQHNDIKNRFKSFDDILNYEKNVQS